MDSQSSVHIEERGSKMGKKRHSKAKCQTRHAKYRAYQRFSVALTDDDIASIIASIQSGDAVFVARESKRVTVFEVEANDRKMFAVYDTKRHTIATFLTHDMIGRHV